MAYTISAIIYTSFITGSRTWDVKKIITRPDASSGTGDQILLDKQVLRGNELSVKVLFDEIKICSDFLNPAEIVCS